MVSLNNDTSLTKDKFYSGFLIDIDDSLDEETIKLYKNYSENSKIFKTFAKKLESLSNINILPFNIDNLYNKSIFICIKIINSLVTYNNYIIESNNNLKNNLKIIIGHNYGILVAIVISSYQSKKDYLIKSEEIISIAFKMNNSINNANLYVEKNDDLNIKDLLNNFDNYSLYESDQSYNIYGKFDLIKNIQEKLNTESEFIIELCLDIIYVDVLNRV